MQIMVELNKELYNALQKNYILIGGMRGGKTLLTGLLSAIANGTPLPDKHGRLIDADALKIHRCDDSATRATFDFVYEDDIEDAPTIIEASEVKIYDE